jgi:hypothetical protein
MPRAGSRLLVPIPASPGTPPLPPSDWAASPPCDGPALVDIALEHGDAARDAESARESPNTVYLMAGWRRFPEGRIWGVWRRPGRSVSRRHFVQWLLALKEDGTCARDVFVPPRMHPDFHVVHGGRKNSTDPTPLNKASVPVPNPSFSMQGRVTIAWRTYDQSASTR